MSEPEIFATDKANSTVVPAEHFQKLLPGHIAHFLVKGQRHHGIHGIVMLQQPLPIPGVIDQPRSIAQSHGLGMDIKSHCSCLAAMLPGQSLAGSQKGCMADMDPVKKTQGIDGLVHKIYL